MSFEDNPADDDPHGECRHEIDRLTRLAETFNSLTVANGLAKIECLEALQLVFDTVNVPDRNCSCHIAPPCSDCIDYSATREALAVVKATLEKYPVPNESRDDANAALNAEYQSHIEQENLDQDGESITS